MAPGWLLTLTSIILFKIFEPSLIHLGPMAQGLISCRQLGSHPSNSLIRIRPLSRLALLTWSSQNLIIELWAKRKFKCDCGNSKFRAGYCKLLPSKYSENEENAYNQNFKGKYCTCGRPYPDPDAEEQVEMIQCCICEDWFHEEHLGHESTNEVKIPVDVEGEPLYEDLICHKCSSICSFLHLYPPTIWASEKEQAANPSIEKDVVSAPSTSGSSSKLEDGTSEIRDAYPVVVPDANSKSPHDDKDVVLGEKSVTCLLGPYNLSATELAAEKSQPMFLAKNWREALYGCDKCSDFYAKKGISYLLDKEDSIAEYERMAKQKRDEKMQQQEGAELNFLSNLGHAEKIEILSGIADMKYEIRSFLGKNLIRLYIFKISKNIWLIGLGLAMN